MFVVRTHNAFTLLVGIAGLSIREAAEFLKVSEDTTKSWASGRRQYKQGVIEELRTLVAHQEAEAARHLSLVRRANVAANAVDPKFVAVGARTHYVMPVPDTDDEARKLGFPCVGAWRAMAGRLVASEPDVGFGGMDSLKHK